MRTDAREAEQCVVDVAARHAGLRLAVLFGSRARGDATERSDWDIGYLGDQRLDPDALLTDLVLGLGTDRIDLVDLQRASGLVRFRAARDGRPLFQAADGIFEQFWLDAVGFWCDAGPVLRHAYEGLLAELER